MQQDSKQLIKGLPRRILLMLLDCGLIVFCYWLAVMLRFDSGDAYKRVLTICAPWLPCCLCAADLYDRVLVRRSVRDHVGVRRYARPGPPDLPVGLGYRADHAVDLFYRSRPISGAVLIFGAVFNTAAIAGVRFLWRLCTHCAGARAT